MGNEKVGAIKFWDNARMKWHVNVLLIREAE